MRGRGAGIKRLVALVRQVQSPSMAAESTEALARALAYNWVIFGRDAHEIARIEPLCRTVQASA